MDTPKRSLPIWRTALAYRIGQWSALALLTLFTRRRIYGAEHIRRNGKCLLAANHISHFDPPLIGLSVARTMDWMATAEFFSHGALGWFLRTVGAFPVDRAGRDPRAVREAARRLKRGALVGMFPEGGIRAGATSVLEGAPIRAGVGRLAAMTQAPVVPCVILGSDRLYDPQRWRPWRRVPVWVGFGPAISPQEWEGAAADLLGERLRKLYGEMQAAFRLRPEDLPMTPQRRKGHF